ncbi:MAG TPA: phosphate ABC transporter substrate-binding protein PstS [Thermoplasmata archaeon]|jgi:phosphate ABC transporter phosphate-binding protein|nr:phosphate ABC transporter substrate-binding protein PstS [Thermoplasmata archaeon]
MSGTPADSSNTDPKPTPPNNEPTMRRRASRTPLYAAVAVVAVVVIVLLVGFSAGWFAKKSSPGAPGACPTGETILAAGASFITPIMSAWQSGYSGADGNTVSYSASGAGAGISSLSNAQVDIAATDNPINATTQSQMKGPILTLPITGGALAIVYNLPGVTTPLKLSGPTIADIYLGLITNWNDSRITANNSGFHPGSEPIYPLIRADAAGTTYVLTNFLSEDSPKWNSSVGQGITVAFPHIANEVGETGNSGVYKQVLKESYSFGYVDLTDVLNHQVQYASVLNPAGVYITPNLANSESAVANVTAKITLPAATGNWNNVSLVNSKGTGDYPLVTFSYAFVYEALNLGYQPSVGKSQAIQQFLTWVTGPGQADAASLYYVNLPSNVLAIDATGLHALTFNGAAIPACG